MNTLQKKARFVLAAFGLNLVAGAVLFALLPVDDHANSKFLGLGVYQIQGYGLWLAAFLVAIVVGDFLYRKRPGDIVDERDEQISQKATIAAYTVFFWCIGIICAAIVIACGPLRLALPAMWVVGPLIVGGIVFGNAAYSIAILVQYGRGVSDE